MCIFSTFTMLAGMYSCEPKNVVDDNQSGDTHVQCHPLDVPPSPHHFVPESLATSYSHCFHFCFVEFIVVVLQVKSIIVLSGSFPT